ncbi:MAG: hypothetical protein OXQ92_05140 [Boseongicola sp.]|nr:hypothetical protein [Boseongicola sp.]MDD9979592.1 hypothetical protein [Boseongicola sp.]
MDVTETLDQLRKDVPGCDVAAFADLSSSMVLCVSSDAKPAQEEIDGLCASASTFLNGVLAEGASAVVGDGPLEVAMTADGSEARVFLRTKASDNEVLICLCHPDTELGKLVDCGRTALASILKSE